MTTLEDAITLATKAHHGQVDKAGEPYILHPLRVMFRFDQEIDRMVAVLHDVIEDSEYTSDDLKKMGYGEEVLTALDCLTKQEGESYLTFVQRAKSNPIARRVKLADIEDNMDLRRLKIISMNDLQRLQRYRVAWEILRRE